MAAVAVKAGVAVTAEASGVICAVSAQTALLLETLTRLFIICRVMDHCETEGRSTEKELLNRVRKANPSSLQIIG